MLNRLTSAIGPATVPVIAVMLLVGCGTADPVADEPIGVDPTGIEAVPILEQAQGEDDALSEPRIDLIRSEDELAALGADIPLAEGLDFGEQSLVVFALGEQPTGGYWARITGAQLVDRTLWVQAVANAPGEEAMTTQQLTYPYAAAIVPRIDDRVRVESDIRSVTGQQPDAFAPAQQEPQAQDAPVVPELPEAE